MVCLPNRKWELTLTAMVSYDQLVGWLVDVVCSSGSMDDIVLYWSPVFIPDPPGVGLVSQPIGLRKEESGESNPWKRFHYAIFFASGQSSIFFVVGSAFSGVEWKHVFCAYSSLVKHLSFLIENWTLFQVVSRWKWHSQMYLFWLSGGPNTYFNLRKHFSVRVHTKSWWPLEKWNILYQFRAFRSKLHRSRRLARGKLFLLFTSKLETVDLTILECEQNLLFNFVHSILCALFGQSTQFFRW